jgi:hypothetical protein
MYCPQECVSLHESLLQSGGLSYRALCEFRPGHDRYLSVYIVLVHFLFNISRDMSTFMKVSVLANISSTDAREDVLDVLRAHRTEAAAEAAAVAGDGSAAPEVQFPPELMRR